MTVDLAQVLTMIERHDATGLTALIVFIGLFVWKRYAIDIWDRLPKWVQFAMPFVVVGGTAFAEYLDDNPKGTVLAALLAGIIAATSLIGTYHGLKRAPVTRKLLECKRTPKPAPVDDEDTSPGGPPPPSDTPPSGGVTTATIVLCGLLAAGCAPVKDASDMIAGICEGYLAATPEVQTEANRKAVSPLVIAEAICLLNDAGRYIWQLFSQPAADGTRGATPAPQLEAAKARALTVARARGLLP